MCLLSITTISRELFFVPDAYAFFCNWQYSHATYWFSLSHSHKAFLLHALTFEKAVIPTKATTNNKLTCKKVMPAFLRRFLLLLLLSQSEFISSYHRFTSNGIREFLLVPIGSTGSAIRYSESDRRSHTLQKK